MEPALNRTDIRRLPDKAVRDRPALHAVLDAGMVAHAAFVHDGQPYAIPVAYGRDGESVLFHGSSGSRLFRLLATGAPCCLSVTLLDGLILARSAFEASMRYRSAMILGSCTVVEDQAPALRLISEHLTPGRWDVVRPPSRKELAATLVLRLPLDEWSLKVSDGWPETSAADEGFAPPVGVIPIRTVLDPLVPGETPLLADGEAAPAPGQAPLRPGGDASLASGETPLVPGGEGSLMPGGEASLASGDTPLVPGGEAPLVPGGEAS